MRLNVPISHYNVPSVLCILIVVKGVYSCITNFYLVQCYLHMYNNSRSILHTSYATYNVFDEHTRQQTKQHNTTQHTNT